MAKLMRQRKENEAVAARRGQEIQFNGNHDVQNGMNGLRLQCSRIDCKASRIHLSLSQPPS
jgi:hypothetical protein